MAVKTQIEYIGELRCEATHELSQNKMITDAPIDNHGKGQAFSPTDLVGVALGSCMLTIMGIFAQNNNIDIKGATVDVLKEMVADPNRRIGKLTVVVNMPKDKIYPDDVRKKLAAAAHTCPVHKTLHPDTQIITQFVY